MNLRRLIPVLILSSTLGCGRIEPVPVPDASVPIDAPQAVDAALASDAPAPVDAKFADAPPLDAEIPDAEIPDAAPPDALDCQPYEYVFVLGRTQAGPDYVTPGFTVTGSGTVVNVNGDGLGIDDDRLDDRETVVVTPMRDWYSVTAHRGGADTAIAARLTDGSMVEGMGTAMGELPIRLVTLTGAISAPVQAIEFGCP